MQFNWQGKGSNWEGAVVKELRRASVLLLGLVIYLCLYLSFGSSHKSSSSTTEEVEKFPRKVWQSWKVDPLRFEDRDAGRARTWVVKNPRLRYEVLTDGNGLDYVEHVFRPAGFNRPDIIEVYKSLSDKIIQADLLRYIIMYAEGGIWADIDVEAVRPFDQFIPKRYNEQDLDMIIGIETDEPDFVGHPVLGSKAQSFCQWTFACKPGLPVMLKLVEHILIWLNELAQKQGKPISQIQLDFDEVLSGTGPSAFTEAILAEMSKLHGRSVTWKDFHDLEESRVVGRILVLPSEAFAAGTGHSDSGNHGGKGALVKHHFHASSWTKSHPRFKHPIYGEVEKCNWDVECVKLWDANTAFFSSLSPQVQSKMIAIKELDEDQMLKPEIYSSPQGIFALPESTAGDIIGGFDVEASEGDTLVIGSDTQTLSDEPVMDLEATSIENEQKGDEDRRSAEVDQIEGSGSEFHHGEKEELQEPQSDIDRTYSEQLPLDDSTAESSDPETEDSTVLDKRSWNGWAFE